MTGDTQRLDRVAQTYSRRRALAGGATLLFAGGTLHILGGSARAAVAMDTLEIPDASLTGDEVTPVADVEVAYSYDVGENPIEALQFALTVGGDEIATAELVTDRTAFEGTTTLDGAVTDADAWDSSDFAPEVASEVSREVTVGVAMDVTATDGSVIVSDSAEATPTVNVAHPQETEWTATVGGRGVVRTATE